MRRPAGDRGSAVAADPAVDGVSPPTSATASISVGTMLVNLKPLEVRKESVEQVIDRLRGNLAKIQGRPRLLRSGAGHLNVGASGGLRVTNMP